MAMGGSGWEADPLDDADFGDGGYDPDGDEGAELGRDHDLGEGGESAETRTDVETSRGRSSTSRKDDVETPRRRRAPRGIRVRPMPERMAKRFSKAVSLTVTYRNGHQVVFVHPG